MRDGKLKQSILWFYQPVERFIFHSFAHLYLSAEFASSCRQITQDRNDISCVIAHDVFALLAGDAIRTPDMKIFADLVEIPLIQKRSGKYFRDTPKIGQWAQNRVYKKHIILADKLFSIGPSMAKYIEDNYNKKVSVIRNCHGFHDIKSSQSLKQEIGLDKQSQIVLFVNAIASGYGLEDAILALELLPKHVHLVCIGSFSGDGFEQKIKVLIEIHALEKRVHFLPVRSPSDYLEIVSEADVGLLLLSTEIENMRRSLPNRFFDFISTKVPIASTSILDIKNYVEDNDIGKIIYSSKIEEIAKTLTEILRDETQKKIRTNLENVQSLFTWEQEEKVFLTLLKECNLEPKSTIVFVANKSLKQNRRIIRMASSIISKGYKPLIISQENPELRLLEECPDAEFIELPMQKKISLNTFLYMLRTIW